MAIKTINVGTKANTGAGDPLRDAMIKINENFSELSSDVVTLKQVTGVDAATGNTLVVNAIQGDVIGQDSSVIVNASTNAFNGDLTGSVFADDSTLLVDGVNGVIPGYISLTTLKIQVAASTDFADFKTRIAAL